MFHGIDVNRGEVLLDGSEAPTRIDAEALLASEKLVPAALLNKVIGHLVQMMGVIYLH